MAERASARAAAKALAVAVAVDEAVEVDEAVATTIPWLRPQSEEEVEVSQSAAEVASGDDTAGPPLAPAMPYQS